MVVVTGLDRPNLHLEASHCPTEEHRWRRLVALLAGEPGTGIVYVPTRRAAEELAAAAGRDRSRRPSSTTAAWPPGSANAAGTRTSSPTGRRSWSRPRRSAWASTSPTSAGWRTWPCRTRPTATCRRSAGPGGTAGPRRAAAAVPARGRRPAAVLQRRRAGRRPRSATWSRCVRERPHTRAELRERSGCRRPQADPARCSCWRRSAPSSTGADGKLGSPAGAPLPVEAARLALAEVERHQTVQRTRIDMMRQFAESRSCRGGAGGSS